MPPVCEEVETKTSEQDEDTKAVMEFEQRKFEVESNNRLRRELAELDLQRCEMEYNMKVELAETEKDKLLIEMKNNLLHNLVAKTATSHSNVASVDKEEFLESFFGVSAGAQTEFVFGY